MEGGGPRREAPACVGPHPLPTGTSPGPEEARAPPRPLPLLHPVAAWPSLTRETSPSHLLPWAGSLRMWGQALSQGHQSQLVSSSQQLGQQAPASQMQRAHSQPG